MTIDTIAGLAPGAPGEAVEAGLDALIHQRHRQRLKRSSEEQSAEDLWMASVRLHEDRKRRRQLWDKLRHHQAMIHSHARNAALVERHQRELERCEAALGISTSTDRMEGAA